MIIVHRISSPDPVFRFHRFPRNGVFPFLLTQNTLHLFDIHLIFIAFDERFEKAEVESAPPTGDFVVMARCGLSGTLLAPPNHHSYAARVREVRQALYPAMGEEQYRQRIESVRDPALIEQWKASCCRQTVYRLKQPEGAAPGADLSRADAESLFVR